MSNLIKNAHKSKLSQLSISIEDNAGKEKLLRKVTPSELPRSYRLDAETLDILKEVQNRVSNVTGKKISESRLVRALISMSKTISDEKIIKALKQIL